MKKQDRFRLNQTRSPERAKLIARPKNPIELVSTVGLLPLELGDQRDGLIYVPKSYQPNRLYPLIVTLHGAGGNGQSGLVPLLNLADENEYILLAPESRSLTWDMIRTDYGPDVEYIDEALEFVFERYGIQSNQIAISGFSDGASYALSLGIANGDLFKFIIAFSPGFMAPPKEVDSPKIFISHGIYDQVL